MRGICLAAIPLVALSACNGEEQFLERINQVGPDTERTDLYKARLAASTYIMKDLGSVEISKELIGKLIEMQSFPEARYCIEHLLNKAGEDPDLYYLRAVCYRNEHQYALAEVAIQQAMRIDGSDKRFIAESENIRDEQMRFEVIRSMTQQLVESPADPGLLLERAEAFLGLRMFAEAEFDALKVFTEDSARNDARYLLGLSALLQAEYQEAETIFGDLVNKSETGKEAEKYEQMRSSASVLSAANRRMSEQPDDISPYIDAARELSLLGEFQRAHRVIDRGLQHQENHPNLLHARLFLYLQQGDMARARETAQYIESIGLKVDPQLRSLIQVQ